LLLEVDPASVTRFLRTRALNQAGLPQFMSARTFGNKRYFGMVVADQALRPGKRLQRCKHVRAMHQRFVEGLDWHQTKYSDLFEKKYKQEMKGKQPKRGGFKAFLSEKLDWYDAIYQDIERNGYRPSASIEENVEVALDANGEVLLIDGRHRLVLAQLLGLKKIPVVVNLLAENVAHSLIKASDGAAGRLKDSARVRRRFAVGLAKLLRLNNNDDSLEALADRCCAQLSVVDVESLRGQLLHHTVEQRLSALITVPGGKNGKGVLVNAQQRHHFS